MKSGPIAGFKAYDLRGRIPSELNEDVAYRVGRAYARVRASAQGHRRPRHPAVERGAVARARAGAARFGRRRVRHRAVRHRGRLLRDVLREDGRRHHGDGQPQPARLQRHEVRARGIAPDQRRQRAAGHPSHRARRRSSRRRHGSASDTPWTSCRPTSSICCPTSIRAKLKPLKIVVHAGNGGAGLIIDKLQPFLPFEFIKVQHEPDGSFPNGVPNPMLVENHRAPVEALRAHRADLAVSWDGDYDRCFLFDERGAFIEGYYIVGPAGRVLPAPPSRRHHRPRPAPDLEHARHRHVRTAAGRCSRSPAMPSSSSACAKWTASTAAR